jgi:hypothetical protein
VIFVTPRIIRNYIGTVPTSEPTVEKKSGPVPSAPVVSPVVPQAPAAPAVPAVAADTTQSGDENE